MWKSDIEMVAMESERRTIHPPSPFEVLPRNVTLSNTRRQPISAYTAPPLVIADVDVNFVSQIVLVVASFEFERKIDPPKRLADVSLNRQSKTDSTEEGACTAPPDLLELCEKVEFAMRRAAVGAYNTPPSPESSTPAVHVRNVLHAMLTSYR